MDTITHGIAGALIGKSFFAEAKEESPSGEPVGPTPQPPAGWKPALQGRIAIWAATLGAVFPDSDSIFDAFDTTGMAVLTEHRGITHSLLLLPLWALVLAAATRWLAQRRGWACLSTARLAVIWGAGIASHILLDLINSWGTMIWMPVDRTRVAWDLVFVIDFTLSALVLVPQLAAWAYRRKEGSGARRMTAWMIVSLGAVGVERLARVTGFAFSPWVVAVVFGLGAMLFMVPRRGHFGFTVSRAAWCRAGVLALVGYLGLCAAAQQVALARVQKFASERRLNVERIAAIPMPPSLERWGGLIRAPEGVYEAQFRLLDRRAPHFKFVADAETSRYIEAARQDELAQDFLWFARFPVVSEREAGSMHVVEFRDLRFFARPGRENAFIFRVTLDPEARVVESGWVE